MAAEKSIACVTGSPLMAPIPPPFSWLLPPRVNYQSISKSNLVNPGDTCELLGNTVEFFLLPRLSGFMTGRNFSRTIVKEPKSAISLSLQKFQPEGIPQTGISGGR
jgi:hypothetical protein